MEKEIIAVICRSKDFGRNWLIEHQKIKKEFVNNGKFSVVETDKCIYILVTRLDETRGHLFDRYLIAPDYEDLVGEVKLRSNQTPVKAKESENPIAQWIKTILEDGINLTDWEETFVQSCKIQFNRYGKLSDKQAKILERIYTEKTP